MNGEFRLLRAALRRGWKDNRVKQDALPKEYPFNYEGERNSERTGTYTDDQIKCILENATPQFKPIFMIWCSLDFAQKKHGGSSVKMFC